MLVLKQALYCPPSKLASAPCSQLLRVPILSPSNGLRRWCHVYKSAQFTPKRQAPIVYLFRGHYKEWFDPKQDPSRKEELPRLVDRLVQKKQLPPMVLVGPDLSSDNNHFQTIPANFSERHREHFPPGTGLGQLETHVKKEVIGQIEAGLGLDYPHRSAIGFSLGGLAALTLGLRNTHLFKDIAVYDGSIFFHPIGTPDSIMQNPMFDPVFGKPRNRMAVQSHSPVWLARKLPIKQLERMNFYLQSGPKASEPYDSNYDRTLELVRVLEQRNIPNLLPIEVPRGSHNWYTADKFAEQVLQLIYGHPSD